MATKRFELTHVDPLMLGKINALFGLVIGLFTGIMTLLTSGIVSGYLQTLTQVDPALIERTQQFGFFGLLFFLFTGVVLGFITGALAGVIYNALVKMVGGIKLELEEE